jgi:microcystin-dependent protein
MATLNYDYSFTNNTIANATEVMSNLGNIKSFVETQLVQTDGSVKLGLNGLLNEVLRGLVPVGSINAFAGTVAPTGWLMCDGTTGTTSYPLLNAMVGATTPDLRGHTLVGKAPAAPFNGLLLSKVGSTTSTASHSHSIDHDHAPFTSGDDSPDHDHGYLMPAYGTNPIINELDASTGYSFVGTPNITSGARSRHQHSIDVPYFGGNSGGSSAGSTHGNVQPSALINYIIKHD